MSTPAFRYALYLAPAPDSLLWRMGSAVLGYDAITGERVMQPKIGALAPETLAQLTAEPRRYGFHMTIKAPFRLADGREPESLVKAVRSVLDARSPLPLGPLRVRFRPTGEVDGFHCLEPDGISPELAALERDIVIGLDDFRAPLTREEIERRAPERLTPRQRTLLDEFGYPFVLDEFRPHFSLTGRMNADAGFLGALKSLLMPALDEASHACYRLVLFAQESSSAPFRAVLVV